MTKKISTLLLVDDDQDDRFLFKEALAEADNSVLFAEAANGVDALEKLVSGKVSLPDLIFLDVNMPRMNGLDCLKHLKENVRFKDVPVVMYSTSASDDYQKECFNHGAKLFIEKPSDFWQLCDKLKNVLKTAFQL